MLCLHLFDYWFQSATFKQSDGCLLLLFDRFLFPFFSLCIRGIRAFRGVLTVCGDNGLLLTQLVKVVLKGPFAKNTLQVLLKDNFFLQ